MGPVSLADPSLMGRLVHLGCRQGKGSGAHRQMGVMERQDPAPTRAVIWMLMPPSGQRDTTREATRGWGQRGRRGSELPVNPLVPDARGACGRACRSPCLCEASWGGRAVLMGPLSDSSYATGTLLVCAQAFTLTPASHTSQEGRRHSQEREKLTLRQVNNFPKITHSWDTGMWSGNPGPLHFHALSPLCTRFRCPAPLTAPPTPSPVTRRPDSPLKWLQSVLPAQHVPFQCGPAAPSSGTALESGPGRGSYWHRPTEQQ